MEVLNADQWDQLFPHWPERFNGTREQGDERVQVLTFVFLYEPWPGVVDPKELGEGEILYRAGRWCLFRDGIECLGVDYFVHRDSLDQQEWLAHLLQKSWLYDPTDMLDVFMEARRHLHPAESDDERSKVFHEQMRLAHELGMPTPFGPYNGFGPHVYLPSRMRPNERKAFCDYLGNRGFIKH